MKAVEQHMRIVIDRIVIGKRFGKQNNVNKTAGIYVNETENK